MKISRLILCGIAIVLHAYPAASQPFVVAENSPFVFWSAFEKEVFTAHHQGVGQPLFDLMVSANAPGQRARYRAFKADFDGMVSALGELRAAARNEGAFLERLYYTIHKKYLRWYKTPSTLSNTMEEGTYDCLTGTTFYAMALESLGVAYSIVETPQHIYLVGADHQFLIESTDPRAGFVKGKKAVAKKIAAYRRDGGRGLSRLAPTGKPIGLYELVGLHYYNASVAYYNQGNTLRAMLSLEKGLAYYKGQRMGGLMALIIKQMVSGERMLSAPEQFYINRHKHLLADALP